MPTSTEPEPEPEPEPEEYFAISSHLIYLKCLQLYMNPA